MYQILALMIIINEVTPDDGKPSSDDGKLSSDGGKPSSDDGKLSSDGGKLSSDNGKPSSDGGKLSSDNGKPSSDGGKLSSDNGKPSSDGGQLSSDNGKPSSDNASPKCGITNNEDCLKKEIEKFVKNTADSLTEPIPITDPVDVSTIKFKGVTIEGFKGLVIKDNSVTISAADAKFTTVITKMTAKAISFDIGNNKYPNIPYEIESKMECKMTLTKTAEQAKITFAVDASKTTCETKEVTYNAEVAITSSHQTIPKEKEGDWDAVKQYFTAATAETTPSEELKEVAKAFATAAYKEIDKKIAQLEIKLEDKY